MGNSFKESLRDLLDCNDITIKELSSVSEVPKRSIENYLNARDSIPPVDYACMIEKALGTSVEYLVNGTGPVTVQSLEFMEKDFLKIYTKLSSRDRRLLVNIASYMSRG